MEKVKKLTPHQESQIEVYLKRGLEIGYNCEPLNWDKTQEAIKALYAKSGLSTPQFLLMGSPMGCLLAFHFLKTFKDNENTTAGTNEYDPRVEAIVDDAINRLKEQTEGDTPADDYRAFCVHMEKERHAILSNPTVLTHVKSQLSCYFGAQHCVSWAIFHEYCKNELDIKYDAEQLEQLKLWLEQAKECHWWFPYSGLVICSERHTEVHYREGDGTLHRDEGPAVAYPDGWGLYSLNGVTMQPEHVLTRAEELDPALILQVQNVEQRRELIRKAGVEKFLEKLDHKVIDSEKRESDGQVVYELLAVDLSEEATNQKFLKMLNPSIGVWHVEAVPNSCNTIEEALHERKPDEMKKIPVDPEGGADWFQQGDVCVWPRTAKSLKPRPSKLT